MTFQQGVVSSYYDDEDSEKTVVMRFRDFQRGNNVSSFRHKYVPPSLEVL